MKLFFLIKMQGVGDSNGQTDRQTDGRADRDSGTVTGK